MTSTTKRGFHLPWGGDGRTPDAPPETTEEDAAATPQATDAPAVEPTPPEQPTRTATRRAPIDDLGHGPFSLSPTPGEAPAGATDPDDSLVDPEMLTRRLPDRSPAPEATKSTTTAAAETSPGTAWPEVDRAGSPTHLASDAAPPRARPPVVVAGDPPEGVRQSRRDNPLVIGLVRAMRDAARATRQETTARMRTSATTRMDEIRSEAGGTTVALRKRADEDVAAIREWSKAELARVREETETRIAGRRAQLAGEVQARTDEIERAVEAVKTAAATFEADMERFFEVLSPRRIRPGWRRSPSRSPTLPSSRRSTAPRLPVTRPMGRDRALPRGWRVPGRPRPRSPFELLVPTARRPRPSPMPRTPLGDRLTPDVAAAAEAEAIADLELPGEDAEPPAGSLASVLATAPRIDSPDDLSADEMKNLLGTEAEADESAADAIPWTPVPEQGPDADQKLTRVVVSGLVSVAGISGFKASIARVPGVASVSVTSGSNDDIVFAVVHDATSDLRLAVPTFSGFNAEMTMDDGGVVGFLVTEPGAE